MLFRSNFDYSLNNRNEVLRRHNEIVELAKKSQMKLDANNKAKRYPKTLTEFRIGEIVLIDYENDERRPPTPLHPNKKGPFKIIARNGNVYTV